MKKHIKYFIIIFTSAFLFSCGFTPLYKSESTNFYISEIKTNKYREKKGLPPLKKK